MVKKVHEYVLKYIVYWTLILEKQMDRFWVAKDILLYSQLKFGHI